jgi:hypothetical protein
VTGQISSGAHPLCHEADAHLLRHHIRRELADDDHLALNSGLICNANSATSLHLAVMTGPFLKLIISGHKSVESRFHRVRQAPLFAANAGDIIAFKQSGGPVSAIAIIADSNFVSTLEVPLEKLRSEIQHDLAATDDAFWEARSRSRWVSLLALSRVREIEPIEITKRDRRGWIRYQATCRICDGQSQLGSSSKAVDRHTTSLF